MTNRRSFLKKSTGCGAHLLGLSAFGFGAGAQAFAAGKKNKVVASERWGRLEEITPGVWALISTGFQTRDYTTLCNGGIIAGKTGVLAIEGTNSPKGAKWLKAQAEKLAGRAPTDMVVTHYHGDHVNGHSGYHGEDSSLKTWVTPPSRAVAELTFKRAKPPITPFQNVQELSMKKTTEIDLGGRTVSIVPRKGHTMSDVTIEISDPKVVWTGDLFFNRVFPNYGDSTPNLLNDYATEMSKLDDEAIVVPGHGQIADQAAIKVYQTFLKEVQMAATKSHEAGKDPLAAAAEYSLPRSLKEWLVWSPQNIKRAFVAWHRVLDQ